MRYRCDQCDLCTAGYQEGSRKSESCNREDGESMSQKNVMQENAFQKDTVQTDVVQENMCKKDEAQKNGIRGDKFSIWMECY